MRILIQTLGSAGDTYPFVELGRKLRSRGHEVAIVINEHFSPAVERAGIEPIVVGSAEEYRQSVADPDLWHPTKGLEVVLRRGVFPGLEETVRRLSERITGDTLLIGSTLGFAARMVRELHPVPLVTVHLAPLSFRSLHRVPVFPVSPMRSGSPRWWKRVCWALIEKLSDARVLPRLNAIRAGFGLGPTARVFYDWILSPDLNLGLFPDWFGPQQPDWPGSLHLTGFCILDQASVAKVDHDLESWLDAGEPPIVFTHGSAQAHSEEYFAESVKAAALLERRALLVAPERDSVPRELPGHARHVAYAPFDRLLPRAAALVSHGGIGTCAAALASGVPHLVVPLAFDQFDNASRVVDLGTGASLPARRYRADRAAEALRGMWARCAAACERARARILEHEHRQESADQAIELIERCGAEPLRGAPVAFPGKTP